MKPQKPTIDVVASLTNVSRTTISRFLNGKYEYMSEETRNRIQEVIDELNYKPNSFARSLKSNKTGLIGVVVADIASPFSSILVKGIGDYCNQHGYQIITANTDEDPVKEQEYLESLVGGGMVEGLIVNTTGSNDSLLSSLGKRGTPIVLADRAMKKLEFDTITNDNFAMTQQTLEHLVNSGFEQIALFTQKIGDNSSRLRRLQAFQDFFEYPRDSLRDVFFIDATSSESYVGEIKMFLEQTSSKKRAIFAINGVTLLAVVRGAIELNLKIPDDIGICGYDDWEWTTLIQPGITAITQPSYQVGVEVAKRVISRIQGKKMKPKLIELESKLNIRGSTILKTNTQENKMI